MSESDGRRSNQSLEHRPKPLFLHSFTRITSGGRFVPCVDGLRCIAILTVVLYHLNGYVVAKATGFSEADARTTWAFHLLHSANFGVQLFFTISGFILALPFAREKLSNGRQVSLKAYYLRRVTRIEPPFLINVGIIFALLIIVRKESIQELVAPLLATLTYTHNWIYGKLSAINVVTWSLEIEVQFYILAPFLARWYFKQRPVDRRAAVFIAICAMVLVKTILPIFGPEKLRLGIVYELNHFLTGILLADVFVYRWQEQPALHWAWDLATLVTIPAMFLLQQLPNTFHFLPICSALLFVSAFRGPLTNRILSLPLVVVTGGMCYSIYLYHLLVISMVGRFTMPLTSGHSYLTQMASQSVLIIPPVVIVCAFFFVGLERPFMMWRPVRATS
jgi:peptidoglycan/LPS O-acetylase OafA/YrhL